MGGDITRSHTIQQPLLFFIMITLVELCTCYCLVRYSILYVFYSNQQAEVLEYLFECGAAVNPAFPGGNTYVYKS